MRRRNRRAGDGGRSERWGGEESVVGEEKRGMERARKDEA